MLRFRECEALRNRVCLKLPRGETMDDEKKKVKQAIALEYDPSDDAPREHRNPPGNGNHRNAPEL